MALEAEMVTARWSVRRVAEPRPSEGAAEEQPGKPGPCPGDRRGSEGGTGKRCPQRRRELRTETTRVGADAKDERQPMERRRAQERGPDWSEGGVC